MTRSTAKPITLYFMEDISFLSAKDKEKEKRERLRQKKSGPVEFSRLQTEPTPLTSGQAGWQQKLLLYLKNLLKAPKSKQTQEQDLKVTVKPPAPQSGPVKPVSVQATRHIPPVKTQASPSRKVLATPEPAQDLSEDYQEVDVNLMPWQDPAVKRNRLIRFSLVLVSLVLIIVWGLTLRFKNAHKLNQVKQIENSIQLIDQQLSQLTEAAAQGITGAGRQRLMLDLYRQLPRWSKFFSWLESRTDPQVAFSSLLVAGENQLTLDASAPDFLTAARQWLSFQQASNWVAAVKISEFQRVQTADNLETIEFTINLKLNAEALRGGE